MRRGLTLIELLVALMMSGFVIVAVISAYSTAIRFEDQTRAAQERHERSLELEQRLRRLIAGAYVSPTENDATTFFLGEVTGQGTDATAADVLMFTTLSESVNRSQFGSDSDFQARNASFGPQGGVAEISLSMLPIGEQGQDRQGLFLREQRPADGDPTQGGYESVLDPDVRSISFEFYNGENWEINWGTSGVTGLSGSLGEVTGQNGRRIPSAVRVTYTIDREGVAAEHSFIVRLPQSDVTAANPSFPGETTAP